MKSVFIRLYKYGRKRIKIVQQYIEFYTHKNVYVFGAPYHSNLGDHAQTFCIYEWVRDNYKKHKIRIFDTLEVSRDEFALLYRIKRTIKKNDYIFLHSGYHTTDLYMYEELMQRKVVELFPEKRIVLLPQTIFYHTEEEIKSREIYNNHNDIVLMCRDQVSYDKANEIFSKCKLMLYPDIVTSMIGKYKYTNKREGILLCMRNDKEAIYPNDKVEELMNKLKSVDTVSKTDTTIEISNSFLVEKRKEILEDIWKKYSKYRVIITDRYHGTIFSLIANTPVIVLPSVDHKLKSGVKWFPEEFSDYVQYAEKFEDIIIYVKSVYERDLSYDLPAYFQTNYYSKLKQKLEEI